MRCFREAIQTRFIANEPVFAEGHGDFHSVFDCSKIKERFGW
jgi:hypothetical protein